MMSRDEIKLNVEHNESVADVNAVNDDLAVIVEDGILVDSKQLAEKDYEPFSIMKDCLIEEMWNWKRK
jgi:hypothetical protein